MIFIPYNVPSSKNSKVATQKGVFHSKTVRKYLQKIGVKHYRTRLSKKQIQNGLTKVENYATRPNLFRLHVGNYFDDVKYPVKLKMFFVRDSRREFDFSNAAQIIADLLVAHDYLKDDSMKYFIPIPMCSNGQWYSVNPKHPGVFLKKVEVSNG